MDLDNLRKELKKLGVEPADIKFIQPRYQDYVNFILYFKRNTLKIEDLQEIQAIFYTMVKWELIEGPSEAWPSAPNASVQVMAAAIATCRCVASIVQKAPEDHG